MNYETEPWIKLYTRESTEDRLLPVLNRGLRDLVLRLAKSRDDGTILSKTSDPGGDVARALGAHATETEAIADYVRSMLADGYLSHRKGRLWITNFAEAQARSSGAKRQAKWRANRGDSSRKRDASETDRYVTRDVSGDVTRDVSRDGGRDGAETSLRSDPIRSDPIRNDPIRNDPTPDPDPERAGPRARVVPGDFSDLDPNPNANPEPDPGRETICPANLVERLENNGTVQQLAEKLAKPIDVVRDELGRFLAYWTIGKGMGQKRTAWAGKARQWVIEQAGKPGGMRAPGAIEHDRRAGEYQPSASTVAALGAGLIRGMPR